MKKLFAALCLPLLLHTQAQAQCNPQFNVMASPALNNLLSIQLYNTTTPPSQGFTSYSVNYGDNSGTQAIWTGGTHNYTSPGNYMVSLYMYTYDSLTQQLICADTMSQQLTVSYPACGATIASQNNGGGSFTFTANNPANTSGLSYSWNFGDGQTGSGAVASHTYANPGNYNVTLLVTGPGCSYGNETYVATIGSGLNCDSLSAGFSYSVTANTASFTNTSTVLPFFPALYVYNEAIWNFGDGVSGYGNNVSHSYAAAGTYNVRLINSYLDSLTQTIHCVDTIIQQVTVGNPPQQQNYIMGTVLFDSLPALPDSVKIWLIKHDTVANTLWAVDSQLVSGFAPDYFFANKPAGLYLVKAAIPGQPAGVTGWLPTYHYASAYWGGANPINHTGGAVANKNIWMQSGTTTSGPGFIGGNISQGAGKGTGTGVAGMLIFLRSNSNGIITSTYTDANGDYAFNVPAGSYNIYPEELGYGTIPSATLTVQSGQMTKDGVDFEQLEDVIRPKAGVGIREAAEEGNVRIFPNPVRESLTIEAGSDVYTHASVVNTLGQVLVKQPIHKGRNSINTAGLAPGMYYLQLKGKEHATTIKLTK